MLEAPITNQAETEMDLPDEVKAILADPAKLERVLALVKPSHRRRISAPCGLPDHPLADLPIYVDRLVTRMKAQGLTKSEAEMREYAWQTEVREHLKGSQLPDRFWNPLKEWHPKQRMVYDACENLLTGVGAIIALVGPRGVGKTTVAAQLILRRAMDETIRIPMHKRPPYRKAISLIAKLKPVYSDFGSIHTESLRLYMEDFCKVHPFVVIDETGEVDDLKVQDRLITDVLDRRYSYRNDTILISNQTYENFIAQTNPSTLSRLEEHGEVIVCDWPSFRTKPALTPFVTSDKREAA